MDKKDLKNKFSEYLKQGGESEKKLEETIKRFGSNIFEIFFDGLENYRKSPRYYKQVFNEIVLPQMKYKAEPLFGNIYFKPSTFERYQSLFVSFMKFVDENKEYINELMLDKKKKNIENSVDGMYGNYFNKKTLIHAWHNYIKTDKGDNGDKLREYLADIYGLLNDEKIKGLYKILFESYEIFSRITAENHESKGKEGFEKKNAFDEAFLNLKGDLGDINGETLSKIRSLFGKYLNFIPRYRDKLITTIKGKPEKGKRIQKDTEMRLLGNFGKGESISKNRDIPGDYSYVGDGFGPMEIIGSDEYGIYTRRGDILPPDYGIFPDFIPDSEGDFEDTKNGNTTSNNLAKKKSEDSIQGGKPLFDIEEKMEEGENPGYTGDYTDSYYRNR